MSLSDLKKYFEENIKKGYDFDILKQQALNQGYSSSELDLIESELSIDKSQKFKKLITVIGVFFFLFSLIGIFSFHYYYNYFFIQTEAGNLTTEDYILLGKNIPGGYKLAPKVMFDSITTEYDSNPGRSRSKLINFFNLSREVALQNGFTLDNSTFYHSLVESEKIDYITAIYLYKETNGEFEITVIDPANSTGYNLSQTSTRTKTLLKTKEGFIIEIDNYYSSNKDFIERFNVLFTGITQIPYASK